MIAQLVDTDNNDLDVGDKVKMGMYPTAIKPVWPADFEAWGITSHTVVNLWHASPSEIGVGVNPAINTGSVVFSKTGVSPTVAANGTYGDVFREYDHISPNWWSTIVDQPETRRDAIDLHKLSPSSPAGPVAEAAKGTGDDYLIDVEIYVPAP